MLVADIEVDDEDLDEEELDEEECEDYYWGEEEVDNGHEDPVSETSQVTEMQCWAGCKKKID
ncbi:uncharacterized protein N7483_010051 [Penicillium malachiteum]|uniref:uncharacterized protein n=1 Tax=Penicillium malachiteum TaxID=1324776 RepID=UPI00254708D2|nr:uncharacterized protein N7483_010051 [Penicillium malachiteum]KAJ5712870.1 hypothetical protein N7483_010051 [Penicillium malachiteum]